MLSALFLISAGAIAQQPPLPEEVQINQYREEIRLLVAKPPASDSLLEAHRIALASLRGKLRDLLMQKVGALKKDIRDLKLSNSSVELQHYVQRLETELKDVQAEIQGLDTVMPGLAAAPLPASTTLPGGPPALPGATPSAAQREFEEAVKSFSAEKLKAAAAPSDIMANQTPQANCSVLVQDEDPNRFPKYEHAICFIADNISNRKAGGEATAGISLKQNKGQLFTILIAKLLRTAGKESLVSFITEAQEARTDQQVGAGSSSSGTTSLVSKGGVPYALGFAVENGAAVKTQSGTTATFRINPGGMVNLFAKKGFITGFQETENDPVMKFLRKSSVGLSFDTSRGANAGTFVGDRQQLSAVSFRYEFLNDRDPRLKKYQADWEHLVATVGEEFADTTWATTRALQSFGPQNQLVPKFKDAALQAWLDKTNQQIAGAGPGLEVIATIIRSAADQVPVALIMPDTIDAITTFAQGFENYEKEKNRLLDRIARAKVFTLEYTNNREVNAPDTSNFNFIAATGSGARVDLTANGSFTFFNKRPIPLLSSGLRVNRIRDFQFAGQVDVPFKLGDGQFDFWFSGRYERLLSDASTLVGSIMPGTKGDIAVGQFGLNIPVKSLGIKFPVSFTFANRTELVKEKEVRGNFGFTFNWDTLWSKLKPF
jgi:hypothetical protein